MSAAIDLGELRAEAERRSKGSLPISEWGPVCYGCGDEEYRIDGYCSIECRDFHDEELAPVVLALVEAVEAAQALAAGFPFLEGEPGVDFGGAWEPFVAALAPFAARAAVTGTNE